MRPQVLQRTLEMRRTVAEDGDEGLVEPAVALDFMEESSEVDFREPPLEPSWAKTRASASSCLGWGEVAALRLGRVGATVQRFNKERHWSVDLGYRSLPYLY